MQDKPTPSITVPGAAVGPSAATRTRPADRRIAGALTFMAAGACFVGMDIMAKFLADRVSPIQTLWARYGIQMVIVLAIAARALPHLVQTRHLKAQLGRSLFLFAATACFFVGYKVNGLTLTVAIANTAPFFVGLGAAVFLGERFGPVRLMATAIGLAGAVLIIRPGSSDFTAWALLPFLGALCYSSYALTTRAIGPDEDVMTSLFYSGLIATVVTTLAVPFAWQPLETGDLPFLLAVGLFGALGQLLLIRALGWAEAGFLAPFMYIQLILAALMQVIVFRQAHDRYTLIGALLVIGGGLLVWWRERRSAHG